MDASVNPEQDTAVVHILLDEIEQEQRHRASDPAGNSNQMKSF
jgi:hypothetical protein